jgi:hypothetical protein
MAALAKVNFCYVSVVLITLFFVIYARSLRTLSGFTAKPTRLTVRLLAEPQVVVQHRLPLLFYRSAHLGLSVMAQLLFVGLG